jgi:hypothetical protein
MVKKKKSTTRRGLTGGAGPSAGRRGRGRARTRATGRGPDRTEVPQHAQLREELVRFAFVLRKKVSEARRFYWNVFEGDGEWPQTKKGQTQFTNRVERLARELRELSRDFAGLRTGCLSDPMYGSVISTLDRVGLDARLLTIATQMEEISSRARQPLTAEQRRDLLNDIRARDRTLEAMLTAAEWIEDEVKAIRGRPWPGRTGGGPLPEEIEDLLISSEQGAQTFAAAMRNFLGRGLRGEQAAIEVLTLLLEEQKRLDGETNAFAATLRAFTDSHWELADQGGHQELLRFLDLKEDVLRRVEARRGIGIRLLQGLIGEVKRHLSYDDDSDANESVHAIIPALNNLESSLQRQQDLCEHLAGEATNERVAATVRESDLPDWGVIRSARPGDGSQFAGLDQLIVAFRDETGDGETSFGTVTTKALRTQLNRLFPAEGPFADPWVRRRLKRAVDHGIVVPLRRVKGQSLRIPLSFQLSVAAIRKYGPHVPPGPRLQSD